jgi:hypothetical protein
LEGSLPQRYQEDIRKKLQREDIINTIEESTTIYFNHLQSWMNDRVHLYLISFKQISIYTSHWSTTLSTHTHWFSSTSHLPTLSFTYLSLVLYLSLYTFPSLTHPIYIPYWNLKHIQICPSNIEFKLGQCQNILGWN